MVEVPKGFHDSVAWPFFTIDSARSSSVTIDIRCEYLVTGDISISFAMTFDTEHFWLSDSDIGHS